jgi:sporulation related protein
MKISSLKHYSLRLWIAIILGGTVSLWLLPAIQPTMALYWAFLPVLGVMVATFILFGWVSDRIGLASIERSIREATAWERDSMHEDAEASFQKAAAVFDSFLLSPSVKQKHATPLASQLARYYLARADKDHEAEDFIFSYLKSHPEDREVAEQWLQQISLRYELDKTEQDLLSRIGSAHTENHRIQQSIARLYLSDFRSDFHALQTYRRVLEGKSTPEKDIIGKLTMIFLSEGRADEWALNVYLRAYQMNLNRPEQLKGIAACVYWMKDAELAGPSMVSAKKLLSGIDENRLASLREGFNPPITQPMKKKRSVTGLFLKSLGNWIGRAAGTSLRVMRSALYHWTVGVGNLIGSIRRSRRSRRIIKWSASALLAVIVVVLVINTLRHLIKPDADRSDTSLPFVSSAVTDPFTIQVAAYLKPEHAKRYAKTLEAQGLDVYWRETKGIKKKWYQVRISHFPDKASAKAYGDSLKARGIIDDFYVANNDPAGSGK